MEGKSIIQDVDQEYTVKICVRGPNQVSIDMEPSMTVHHARMAAKALEIWADRRGEVVRRRMAAIDKSRSGG